MNEFLYEFIERESFNVYIIIVPKLWWHTSAHLQFAQTHLCLKIDNLRHWNLHSLKFAH